MDIVGLNSATFGVDDLETCKKYYRDFGLTEVESGASGAVFAAQDGTYVTIRNSNDSALPKAVAPSPNCRETIYAVRNAGVLEQIGAELGKDREVKRDANGTLHSFDDSGYPIAFAVDVRKPYKPEATLYNIPGEGYQRPPNVLGARVEGGQAKPRTLSHIVFMVPDAAKAEKFYVERLGFRVSDRFDIGPFLRPAGTNEHHSLFLIQGPPQYSMGMNHLAFHVAGPNEVLFGGQEFSNKGWKGFWGPGRHIFGSNYFWYFNSPFGGAMEYDADMDLHDDNWKPRYAPAGLESSQLYNFNLAKKFFPGGP